MAQELRRKKVVRESFILECDPFALFGWIMVSLFSTWLILPSAWLNKLASSYICEHLKGDDEWTLRFSGIPRKVWLPFAFLGIRAWLLRLPILNTVLLPWGDITVMYIILMLPMIISLALITRWTIEGIRFYTVNCEIVPSFQGNLVSLAGWHGLLILSSFIIVPFPWVAVSFMRWIAKNTRLSHDNAIVYYGTGEELLVVTLIFMVWSVPLVTLPWSIRWYASRFFERFRITNAA